MFIESSQHKGPYDHEGCDLVNQPGSLAFQIDLVVRLLIHCRFQDHVRQTLMRCMQATGRIIGRSFIQSPSLVKLVVFFC